MNIEVTITEPEGSLKGRVNKARESVQRGGSKEAAISNALDQYAGALVVAANVAIHRKTAELEMILKNEIN